VKLLQSLAYLAFATAAAGCQTTPTEPELLPSLARTRASDDFASYDLRRVGILPLSGAPIERTGELHASLGFELARRAPFEVITLGATDLAELQLDQPHARGRYTPQTILAIARRFRLDGIFVGTVTHLQAFSPQSLGLQLELVAVETGLVVWSSSIDLDTSELRVRDSLEAYQAGRVAGGDSTDDVQVLMLSPASLSRFAAGEIARTLEVEQP
jgi:hypothetical protein